MKTHYIIAITALCLLYSCGKEKTAPVLTKEDTALIKQVTFDPEVILKLREIMTGPVKQLVTITYNFDSKTREEMVTVNRNPAIVLGITKYAGESLATKMNDYLKGKGGYLVFKSHDGFNMDKDSIAILKTRDQFDILRAMGTSAGNYDIDNKTVIARLQQWNATSPFIIKGAGDDWVEAEFITQPADMGAFAKELYTFCPDIVDQGTGDVDALAREMKDNNSLYLWWD